VAVATREVVSRLTRAAWRPQEVVTITAEPRAHGDAGQVGFDVAVRFDEHAEHAEAKVRPTKSDVADWLEMVRDAPTDMAALFRFVYADPCPTAVDWEQVARLAREATSIEHFDELCSREANDRQRELIALLGDRRWELARQTRCECTPRAELDHEIDRCVIHLFGPAHSEAVRLAVEKRFAKAAEERSTVSVASILGELADKGHIVAVPPRTDLTGVSPQSAASLGVIAACSYPIPLSAVQRALAPEADLLEELDGLVEVIPTDDEAAPVLVELKASPIPLTFGDVGPGAAAVAQELVDIVVTTPSSNWTEKQLRNLRDLARISTDRRVTAELFPRVDKRFKATGDLQLVHEMARLSLDAAHHEGAGSSSERLARAYAQTAICGISWVFQRVGQYEHARTWAEDSLRRGEAIGWDRNTAFCHKCLGRLCRLEAEVTQPERRGELLAESQQLLERAIDEFGNLDGFGPRHEDVGDCWSLLGRTLLVGRHFREARTAVDRATEILETHPNTKEFVDLLLLDAELAHHEGFATSAESLVEDALAAPCVQAGESSEIRARAFLFRSRLRGARGLKDAAAVDSDRAAEIYDSLGHSRAAAAARLRAIHLRGEVPREIQVVVEEEPPWVAVEAIRLHRESLASRSARSRRAGVTAGYLSDLVANARRSAQVAEVDWG
jgi:tetratricopeptide (TPR) repeat protein